MGLIVTSEVFENAQDQTGGNKLFIVISSDKGLCGGIHSSVSKATRRAFANDPETPLTGNDKTVDPSTPIAVIGDKSKMQLARVFNNNFAMTFNQIGRDIPTFADAAAVADLIVKSGIKYDSVVLIYNQFKSAISYEPASMLVKGPEALAASGACHTFSSTES